jgi:hypothetical protein
MNRSQKSRLNRLEQAADMRGAPDPQAERGRLSDEDIFDGRTLEEYLADAPGGLTIEVLRRAQALAAEANAGFEAAQECGPGRVI